MPRSREEALRMEDEIEEGQYEPGELLEIEGDGDGLENVEASVDDLEPPSTAPYLGGEGHCARGNGTDNGWCVDTQAAAVDGSYRDIALAALRAVGMASLPTTIPSTVLNAQPASSHFRSPPSVPTCDTQGRPVWNGPDWSTLTGLDPYGGPWVTMSEPQVPPAGDVDGPSLQVDDDIVWDWAGCDQSGEIASALCWVTPMLRGCDL
ncbi:hypothetical protein M427DRAFT_464168 [Gonapodya prolifera JEL478]|uniref:Uncharacterized protein n=1 Tax=Gonapodya prolifera (strain JEL478) TaxID=1344416 RepID=A0A139A1N1_GONPJ|nr:hypothetical protein M427DRAFT_464168 [Gonapodya prolifera JEL478]|eukprot:KXS10700.1 hypothetical protein M427DRAFT_464168 [Gonapodya prolifera JEL478]